MVVVFSLVLLTTRLYVCCVGLQVLTAVDMKVNRCFGGIRLATCFHNGILLYLFDPEDGGDMLLRNVC
jgi:hypothetical protein